MPVQGKCLCGAVTVLVEKVSQKLGACHCTMCRKWSGGPFLGAFCGTGIVIEGQEHLTRYDSSAWGERGFCNRCGSHLFYRFKPKDQYVVSVGMFDDVKNFQFDHQIFIDEKPPYYNFAEQTKKLTGNEVRAKMA